MKALLLIALTLATGTLNAETANRKHADLNYHVLNLGQIQQKDVSAWISYPGMRGERCFLVMKLTDGLNPAKANEIVDKLIAEIEVVDLNRDTKKVYPLTSTLEGIRAELTDQNGSFGVMLAIQTK